MTLGIKKFMEGLEDKVAEIPQKVDKTQRQRILERKNKKITLVQKIKQSNNRCPRNRGNRRKYVMKNTIKTCPTFEYPTKLMKILTAPNLTPFTKVNSTTYERQND